MFCYFIAHIYSIGTERKKYYDHCSKARKAPVKYLSIILDRMDQAKTSIPHLITGTKVSTLIRFIIA